VCPAEIYLVPCPFLSFSLLPVHHAFTTVKICLVSGPKQWSQQAMDCNREPKKKIRPSLGFTWVFVTVMEKI
jgi:hypothetical protein